MTTTSPPRPPARARPRPPAGIDPRISARRRAVTRRRGRRRLLLLIALIVLTAVLVGGWFVLHSPWFSARHITVRGATHETPAQVIAAAGLATHPPLLDVDAGAVARRVERMPWVRSATVTVAWPDRVHITLTEQSPQIEMETAGGQWALLTSSGRVLAVDATESPGLIALSGPTPAGGPGTTLGAADRVGLEVASTLPPSFKAQVTAVRVVPAGWVQLAMTTPVVVDIGSASQLSAKYEDVSSLLAGATLHDGDVIDVSVPDAPTVTGG
ncbi:MAG: cell division protein FtsQ/DivIB [Acidimicrobiales bacterium]